MWKTNQLHIKFKPNNVGKNSTCQIPIHHVPYAIYRVKLFALSVEFCHARGVFRKNDKTWPSINIYIHVLQLCQIEYLNKIQSYMMAELYCMHMVAFTAECYLIRWLARLSNEVEIWPGVAGCVVFCSDNSTYQISQSGLSLSLVAMLTAGWQDCGETSKMATSCQQLIMSIRKTNWMRVGHIWSAALKAHSMYHSQIQCGHDLPGWQPCINCDTGSYYYIAW